MRSVRLTVATLLLLSVIGGSGSLSLAQEKVTITFQQPWALTSERGIVINSIIQDFMAAYPNIKVQIRDSLPAREKVLTEIIAGTAADVTMIPEDWLHVLAKEGAFLDLEPYVAKWGQAKRSDFYDAVWQLGRLEDRQFAIPWVAHSMCLIYNKGMFRQAGMDPNKPPTTWTELLEAARKLTIPDKQYGFGLVGMQSHDLAWYWYIFLHQAGGKLVKKADGRWEVALNSPEGREALEFYLALRDVAPPEASVSHGGHLGSQFEAGRIAMFFMGPWAVAGVRKNMPHIDVGVALPPRGKQNATIVGSGLLAIPRTTRRDKVDAAWKLIDYLTEVGPQLKLVSAGYAFRIPTRKSTLEDLWFRENPEYKHFVSALEYGVVPYPIPEYRMVHETIVQVELNRAFTGDKKPSELAAQALATIEAEGNKILRK